jgi:DNA polymerase III delta subunit
MIYLLHGQDTFSSRQKLKQIIEQFKVKNPSGLFRYFVFPENSLQEVRDELRQVSMFGEKKFLVLEDAYKFIEGDEDFLKSSAVIIFYEREKVQEKFDCKSELFEPLSYSNLRKWIICRFHDFNFQATEEMIDALTSLGNDLWQQEQEIRKIVNFSQDFKIKDSEPEIWSAFGMLDRGDRGSAMVIFDKLIQRGENILWLMAMMGFYYRSRKRGEELRKNYHRLLKMDLAYKNSQIREEEVLALLLSDLSS